MLQRSTTQSPKRAGWVLGVELQEAKHGKTIFGICRPILASVQQLQTSRLVFWRVLLVYRRVFLGLWVSLMLYILHVVRICIYIYTYIVIHIVIYLVVYIYSYIYI